MLSEQQILTLTDKTVSTGSVLFIINDLARRPIALTDFWVRRQETNKNRTKELSKALISVALYGLTCTMSDKNVIMLA